MKWAEESWQTLGMNSHARRRAKISEKEEEFTLIGNPWLDAIHVGRYGLGFVKFRPVERGLPKASIAKGAGENHWTASFTSRAAVSDVLMGGNPHPSAGSFRLWAGTAGWLLLDRPSGHESLTWISNMTWPDSPAELLIAPRTDLSVEVASSPIAFRIALTDSC
ncbi:hypothetical protein M5K25_022554 [Dendrobium thyrsiflorum]|uniref:Uncharacterized protein n=1 Tax=Dendrobium thyrsiflorum TaxID=117978 RepID=A0ABD0U6E0_DENTH